MLENLPPANSFGQLNCIKNLILSENFLTESTLPILIKFEQLRLLDLSYNHFRFFNDRYF